MTGTSPIETRFELVERVGRGSWGEVFRARDRASGELVAVKKLHAHVDDDLAVARFSREARLLASVSSEHVVRYVAHGSDERGTPCLVVEWLEGEDLARRQRQAPLDGTAVIDVARQIARGLAALHAAGIVHRDVKPSNVFLVAGEGGGLHAKLIDLGVALARAEATLTTAGIAIGTPYYMSPEQARGDEDVSASSDLFSLGVLLFELCARQRPFRGDDLFAVLAKIVLSDAPRLRDVMPGAPPELDALVARAMAKDPAARFASAAELADALGSIPPFRAASIAPRVDAAPTTTTSVGLSSTLEQRVVTGVFAKLPPSGGDATPKAAFARIAEAAGGAPHGLLGPNVVAVFGGRRTHGDEVVRAARAALAIAAEVAGARVAVATGRAVTGEGGLTGDVIERGAADLEKVRPGAVHVDAATARLLGDAFDVDDAGGARVLVAARPSAPPSAAVPPRTLLGKATPCVGRDRELATLDALYAECSGESLARAVLVTGAAGAGKSRLRHEMLRRLGDSPALLLFGRGDSLTAGSPFAMLGSAIRRTAGVREGDPKDAQRAAIAALVGRRVDPARRDEVALGVAEIAGLGAATRAADAMHAGDRIRAAWEAWLEAEAREGPVVVVLEDLHAGDVPSVRLVDAALLALRDRPLFVVALARPEVDQRFEALWTGRDLQRMPLSGLSRRAAERLVRAALGPTIATSVVMRLVERADGNAFFLEELIRAVADQGSEAALPDTVLGMVQARLDALGADAKRLLRAASVFGEVFWRGGVAAILGGGKRPGPGGDDLDELARREVLTRRATARFPGEDEFVFRHALVAEASYAGLTEEDRALGHRLAATWLEEAGERDAVALAEHHERGRDAAAARRHWLAAAEQALRGSDFDAVLQRAARVCEGEGVGEVGGAAHLLRAEAHRWRGELAKAAEHAVAAAELLTPATAPWFHAIREAVAANGRLGRIDVVDAWAAESGLAVAAADARGAQIASLAPAAVHLLYAGREVSAAHLADRVEALYAESPDVEPVIVARIHQMRAIRAAHEQDTDRELSEQRLALESFERAGDVRNATLTRANAGYAIGQLGLFEAAEEALRLVQRDAERLGLQTVGPLALHNLGLVLANLGRLDEALDVEQRAVDAFARQGDPRLEGASRVYLARILLARGEPDRAEREARAAFTATLSHGASRIGALAALARALLAQRRLEEAVIVARDAHDLLGSPAIEEWESYTRLAIVEVFEATGDAAGARDALVKLLAAIAVRVERLSDPTTRAALAFRVPEHARAVELARAWGVDLPRSLRTTIAS